LPGLIVDHYANWLVIQSSTAGMDAQSETIIEVLKKIYPKHHILERSDDAVRKLEGLEQRLPLPPGESGVVKIIENNLTFLVDILRGHKTGFYLDQRENRQELMRWAKGRSVLNCFGYTGAFTVAAAAAGAKEIITIDSSQPSLNMLLKNLTLNKFDQPEFAQVVTANVFEQLRVYHKEGKGFDLIVLDPPKLATNTAQINKAARAYKDLNRLAFGLLNPGGILMTFSCSGLVSTDLFQKIIFSAAVEAGTTTQILKPLMQSPDHPVLLPFPESHYLKGFVCRVSS
jgi:23S rRNA (cytosine1962-C5)-methyltransferase